MHMRPSRSAGDYCSSDMRSNMLSGLVLSCTAFPTACIFAFLHDFPDFLQVIKSLREREIPVVIDADGLFIVTRNLDLVRGNPRCVLTPNKAEFARLAAALDVDLDSGMNLRLGIRLANVSQSMLWAATVAKSSLLYTPTLQQTCGHGRPSLQSLL